MRVLVLPDPKVIALKAKAEACPIPLDVVTKLFKEGLPAGPHPFDPFTVDILGGYRITFTLETQRHGVCRHLSVSADAKDRLPHKPVVMALMGELGFLLSLNDCKVWLEETTTRGAAVNVLEPVGGDWGPFMQPRAC